MADVQESPVPAPAPEGVKVFVGNLSFQVGKEELEKEFADAGKVLSANIIMRGSRSRGYGFVEMATDAEADKALEVLNQREIDGRAINVELAKPREENPEQQGEQEDQPRKARGRGRGRGRSGRRGRGRGAQGDAAAEGDAEDAPPVDPEAAASGAAEGGEDGEGGDRPRKRAGRKGRSRAARGRGGRGRGRGAGKSEGELRDESTDTLFVANLPFATNDEELKDFFGEYNPTKAYVVVGRNGRSKGFGFVTFENQEAQQLALKIDGTSLIDRPVAVRVALNPEPQPEKAEEAEGDAPAPVAEEKAEEPEKPAENPE